MRVVRLDAATCPCFGCACTLYIADTWLDWLKLLDPRPDWRWHRTMFDLCRIELHHGEDE